MTAQAGSYSCEAGRVCAIDILDTACNERFLAEPGEGYRFSNWKKARAHFCGDKDGVCAAVYQGTRLTAENSA